MRYAQMTTEQRRRILQDAGNYPLRVTFLGKTGLLSLEEVAFLLRQGIDFALSEAQVREILSAQESAQPFVWPSQERRLEGVVAGEINQDRVSRPRTGGCAGWLLGCGFLTGASVVSLLAAWALVEGAIRLLRRR